MNPEFPPVAADDYGEEMPEVAIDDRDTLPQGHQQLTIGGGTRRFPAWIALMAASIVGTIALSLGKRTGSSAEKWSIWVLVLSFILSLLGTLCYLFARPIFLTGPAELLLSGIILLIWCAGLPGIMNPAYSIAVGYTQIVNANLYLASWASFFCIFWIVGELVGEMHGIFIGSIFKSNVQTRQGKWYALVAASVVVMAASVRVYKAFECDLPVMKAAPTCSDSKYAIAASVIGTVTALLFTMMGFLANVTARRIECVGAVLMVLIWSVGLGFITFAEGPGRSIGNLFFATWAAFVISCLIVAECYGEVMGIRQHATSSSLDQQSGSPEYDTSNGQDTSNVQDL